MQVTKLIKGENAERAVSPVIGVILMVAITVILAAVIGTFVLGLGDQVQQTAPNAQWDWDQPTSSDVEITHTSGQAIDVARLEVRGASGPYCTSGSDWGGVSKVTAGSTCSISGLNSGDELRLVWSSEGGGNTATLTKYTVD